MTVSYADRAPGESFATPPSQAKSIWLLLDAETLQFGEVAQDFEGEADPATMKLDMKTWVWVSARYDDGREIAPRQADAFTLTFGADGRFSATTDCNRVGGTYAAVDDRLTFGDMFATRMFCEGSQEGEFTAMLTQCRGLPLYVARAAHLGPRVRQRLGRVQVSRQAHAHSGSTAAGSITPAACGRTGRASPARGFPDG